MLTSLIITLAQLSGVPKVKHFPLSGKDAGCVRLSKATQVDLELVQKTALAAICDLLIFHGLEALSVDDTVSTDLSQAQKMLK